MSKSKNVGIKLEPSAEFSIDWAKLASAVFGTITKGFRAVFISAEGAGDIVNDLITGVQAFEKEKSPGNQAWNLFLLSFCWSLDKTKPEIHISQSVVKDGVKLIMSEISRLNNLNDYRINSEFLKSPRSFDFYSDLRDILLKSNVFSFTNEVQREEFSHRLDSAFNKAVYEIFSTRYGRFKELLETLSLPAEEAASFEFQWEAYRRNLQYEFHSKPVFGQERTARSLSQLYIPLRCRWIERPEPDKARERVSYLQEELVDWINADDNEDMIRLIGGGPGSGKSTSLKSLASTLASDPRIDVLFIPLQNIDLDSDIAQSINNFFVKRTGSPFETPPLARPNLNTRKRLVLIFDGLDEIARPGEAANDVAGQFAVKLMSLVSQVSGDGSQLLKVIVSGRFPSFQAIKRHIGGSKPAFEVIGYAPYDRQEHINNIDGPAREAMSPKDLSLIEIDQRPIWWQRYNYDKGNVAIPPALEDFRLKSISNEPLLCYLLVLSGFVDENWELAADNNNRIYEKLIRDVWARGWGDGVGEVRRQGPGRTLTASNFLLLMETIALAAWLGGDARVATQAGFEKAVESMKAQDAWASFKLDNGPDVNNLAMNFYLKSADVSLQGFEFTHKSFGEYLAAKAIIKLTTDICGIAKINQESALLAWTKAIGSGAMTVEIWSFIKDELRLIFHRDPESVKMLRSVLLQMTNIVIEFGIIPNPSDYRNWKEAEALQRNSETSLWTMLNCTSRAEEESSDNPTLNEINLNVRNTYLAEIISRENIINSEGAVLPKCLSYLKIEDVNFFGCDLSGADFSFSHLVNINFNGTHLMRSNFFRTKIVQCSFERSNLDNANFIQTELMNCDMSDTRHHRAKFEQVTGVELSVTARTLLDCIPHEREAEETSFPDFLILRPTIYNEHLRSMIVNRKEFRRWKPLLKRS